MGDYFSEFFFIRDNKSHLDFPDLGLAYKVGVLRREREKGVDMSLAAYSPETWGQGLGTGLEYQGDTWVSGANDDAWAIALLIHSLDTDPPQTRRWS